MKLGHSRCKDSAYWAGHEGCSCKDDAKSTHTYQRMQDDLGLIDMAQRQGTAGQPVLVGQRNVLQQDFGCREVRASSYMALLDVLQHSVSFLERGLLSWHVFVRKKDRTTWPHFQQGPSKLALFSGMPTRLC